MVHSSDYFILLSIFTMPWVLYTADWFFVFQNVYSSFLGPMLGIMMVDFWVVNKQSCDMAALYDESGEKYRYKNGFGVSAFLALFISALIAFWQLDIAWIIGIPSAAILYYFFKCLCKLDEKNLIQEAYYEKIRGKTSSYHRRCIRHGI